MQMKFTAPAFLLVSLLLFNSCTKSKFEETNEQALEFAGNDQRIDQREYETLVENIKNSDDRGFRLLKTESGEVDHAKVAAYLKKYFDAKGTTIAMADIWQPGAGGSAAATNFNVSIFLENSASMDGYVDANSTSFKAAMNDMLTNLENFAATDSLNLNYINSAVISVKAGASKTDVDDFYKNLNRTNFKTQGGKRGSSDIGALLSQILNRQKTNELSVLVSDFVFSPGGKDAVKYLEGQRSEIRSEFVNARRKNPDLAVAILQGEAQFEGTYYDRNDKPHARLDAPRPYYVWLMGSAAQIQSILDAKILEQTRNGFTNKLVIQPASEAVRPPYKILYSPKIGSFDAKSLVKGIITDARAARDDRNKGVFEFSLAVNFAKGMQDDSYFLDSTNFKISDAQYSLKAKPITDRNDVSLNSFTHVLTLRTMDLKDEKLTIDVVGKVPGWVYATSSEDDTQIETDRKRVGQNIRIELFGGRRQRCFLPTITKSNPLYTIPLTIKK